MRILSGLLVCLVAFARPLVAAPPAQAQVAGALPVRVEIRSGWVYDLTPGEAGGTRLLLRREGADYVREVLAHTEKTSLDSAPTHVPAAQVGALVDALRAPVPAIPDLGGYGGEEKLQTAVDAVFVPMRWPHPDAQAAALQYREWLRKPDELGRVLRKVRGNFANHLHRQVRVELVFEDGSTLAAESDEMGLRMVPWRHPSGLLDHSMRFADAVSVLMPVGASLKAQLEEPVTDDARAGLMRHALREANDYFDAYNQAPVATQRLRRHFTLLRIEFTDRPEPGDFAAFQSFLKNGHWPPSPPRVRLQLTDSAATRNVVLFAELLLANGDLADPTLIESMQDRLARVIADARLSKLGAKFRITTALAGELEAEILEQFARQMEKAGWVEFQHNPALLRDAVPVNVGSEYWMLLRDGRSVLWKRHAMGRLPQAGEWWCAGTPSKLQRERPEPPGGQRLSRGDDLVCVAQVHSARGELTPPPR